VVLKHVLHTDLNSIHNVLTHMRTKNTFKLHLLNIIIA